MNVQEILSDMRKGKVVLPDFQRSFIWEPEAIRELIVSILGNYFIGTMLTLVSSKKDSLFALRLIEGVEEVNKAAQVQSIVQILLDGQQRATAILYAIEQPEIHLKNRKNPYKFYLYLEKAFDEDWDDAVIAVSTVDKKKLSEIKGNPNIIPITELMNIGKLAVRFKDHPKLSDIVTITNNFQQYEIHIIELPSDTKLEKIVETFERINRLGVPLSTFELLTARLYKGNIKLVDLWGNAKENYNFAQSLHPEFILRVVALLRGKETKRKDLLELEPKHFKEDWKKACNALDTAYQRVVDLKKGYGALDFNKWVPYSTMLVPLASIIDCVKTTKSETKATYDRIDQWYWTAVFSNRYDEGAISKQSHDFNALKDWIANESKIPDFIKEFDTSKVDLNIDKQSAAIYKGVIGLIALEGALDFQTGQPPHFDVEKIQDDHIFPKSIYNYNGILNRTLITTNPQKGNKKPSVFFAEMKKEHGEEGLKRILESHLIPGEALNYLLSDNLAAFIKTREKAIIKNLRKKVGSKS